MGMGSIEEECRTAADAGEGTFPLGALLMPPLVGVRTWEDVIPEAVFLFMADDADVLYNSFKLFVCDCFADVIEDIILDD